MITLKPFFHFLLHFSSKWELNKIHTFNWLTQTHMIFHIAWCVSRVVCKFRHGFWNMSKSAFSIIWWCENGLYSLSMHEHLSIWAFQYLTLTLTHTHINTIYKYLHWNKFDLPSFLLRFCPFWVDHFVWQFTTNRSLWFTVHETHCLFCVRKLVFAIWFTTLNLKISKMLKMALNVYENFLQSIFCGFTLYLFKSFFHFHCIYVYHLDFIVLYLLRFCIPRCFIVILFLLFQYLWMW